MLAHVLIREQPYYRRSAFVRGLEAAGHKVLLRAPDKYTKDTLLVIWNRYSYSHEVACRVEMAGGKVIVAENGYVGAGGGTPKFQVHPHGPKSDHYYALALGFHNGGGEWPNLMDDSRLRKLALPFKPLRCGGDYVLVCPNRSFGVGDRIMHPNWADIMAGKLRKVAGVPVKVRPHPGNNEPQRKLEHDLAGAACVVIWSSSCGIHALIEGIPVVSAASFWICRDAASPDYVALCEMLAQKDVGVAWDFARRGAFIRLSWAQWTCAEIESGEPFRCLLPISE